MKKFLLDQSLKRVYVELAVDNDSVSGQPILIGGLAGRKYFAGTVEEFVKRGEILRQFKK